MARRANGSQREMVDETVSGPVGRGGRVRGTASRSRARTTSESAGEVAGERGGPGGRAEQRGKGAKPDAPGSRKLLSRRAAKAKKKGGNRPGPSGTGPKKQARASSGRRRSGSRSGGGQTNKKE
jgi:hypothetical protein